MWLFYHSIKTNYVYKSNLWVKSQLWWMSPFIKGWIDSLPQFYGRRHGIETFENRVIRLKETIMKREMTNESSRVSVPPSIIMVVYSWSEKILESNIFYSLFSGRERGPKYGPRNHLHRTHSKTKEINQRFQLVRKVTNGTYKHWKRYPTIIFRRCIQTYST